MCSLPATLSSSKHFYPFDAILTVTFEVQSLKLAHLQCLEGLITLLKAHHKFQSGSTIKTSTLAVKTFFLAVLNLNYSNYAIP